MSKVDETVAELIGKDLTLCRDYASIVNWSISKIEKWTSSWTDYSITDPGVLFINADAYLYDIINYCLDESFLNDILRYTKSHESLYIMSKFVGLELPGFNCSKATVRIENANVRYPVDIPKDFELFIKDKSTGEEFHFYSLVEKTLLYNDYDYFSFLEGEKKEIITDFYQFDDLYQFILPTEKVGLNTVFVYIEVDNPNKNEEDQPAKIWEEVPKVQDAFLNLTDGLAFSVHYAYNKTLVKFPPGCWEVLRDGKRIKIVYGVPGGLNANVGEVIPEPKSELIVNDMDVSNLLSYKILHAEGAEEPLSKEDLRVYIGNNSWRTETLLISEDFNQLTKTVFDEVVRFVVEQNTFSEDMTVYFLPKEEVSETRISALFGEIKEYAQDYMFGGTVLSVSQVELRGVSFNLEVTLKINTSDDSEIRERIIELIEKYLDRETQPVGMYLKRNAVISLIEDEIQEVESVAVLSPVADAKVSELECFVLQGISVEFTQKEN